jgi:hypothetical protein
MNLFRKIKPIRLTFGAISDDYFYTPTVHPIPIKDWNIGWYEKMKKASKENKLYFDKQNSSKTVRHCPSFVEILQNGYVIPAPADYFLHLDKDGDFVWHTSFSFLGQTGNQDITFHYDDQLIDHLPSHSDYLRIAKINLPLKLFTPKGYSIQMMRMPYEDFSQWEAVYGMLRTDKNHNMNIQLGNKKSRSNIYKARNSTLFDSSISKERKFSHRMVDLSDKSKYTGKFYKIYKKHYLKTYGSEKPKFRQDYWKEE